MNMNNLKPEWHEENCTCITCIAIDKGEMIKITQLKKLSNPKKLKKVTSKIDKFFSKWYTLTKKESIETAKFMAEALLNK